MIFVMPPRFDGWLLHRPAAVGVEREPAVGRHQGPVEHEASAVPFLAEPEILERLDHRDGERVVDGHVVDVRRSTPASSKARGPVVAAPV
jgi:hypothetical protein